MSTATPEVGALLAGRYRVERILGRGGMGVVLSARDATSGARVAVKLLLPELTSDEEAVGRFLREAQASRRLTSAHVPRLHDVGTLEDGAPYLAMEWLEGEDLGATLAERGHLAVTEAVDLVQQALVALTEAHAAGFIHRDLKPENLFLCRTPSGAPLVKVLDFGITKLTGTATPARTLTRAGGCLLGSPHYMSPEQIRSPKDVDARADVWSMGVILYELVSGVSPFHSESLGGLLSAILVEEPAPLSSLVSPLPDGFAAVVERCLQKAPTKRFASAAELARALAPFGSGTVASERLAADEARERLAKLGEPAPTMPFPSAAGIVAKATLSQVDVDARTEPVWKLSGASGSPRPTNLASALGVVLAALVALAALAVLAVRAASEPPGATTRDGVTATALPIGNAPDRTPEPSAPSATEPTVRAPVAEPAPTAATTSSAAAASASGTRATPPPASAAPSSADLADARATPRVFSKGATPAPADVRRVIRDRR